MSTTHKPMSQISRERPALPVRMEVDTTDGEGRPYLLVVEQSCQPMHEAVRPERVKSLRPGLNPQRRQMLAARQTDNRQRMVEAKRPLEQTVRRELPVVA